MCVSFSGGKDSTVLAHLVHDIYPNVPLIFANTGLEYPANMAKMKEYFPDGDDNALVLCLAYELDRAGFTEHGSSIYSCWLQEDGKYFLWAIQEADRQDELDI